VATGVARNEDTGGDADRVETTIGDGDIVQHATDRSAVGNVSRKPDGRAAIRQTGARDADAEAESVGDFLGGRFRGVLIEVHANEMRAFLHQPMRGFLADAGARTNDDDDLASEFLFRRHSLELRLF